ITASELSNDRNTAIAEWRDYLETFEAIDEAGFHLDRFDQWDTTDPLSATIRFELIGTSVGHRRAGVDRVRLRMQFDLTSAGLLIHGLYLIDGERLFADVPQFVN